MVSFFLSVDHSQPVGSLQLCLQVFIFDTLHAIVFFRAMSRVCDMLLFVADYSYIPKFDCSSVGVYMCVYREDLRHRVEQLEKELRQKTALIKKLQETLK